MGEILLCNEPIAALPYYIEGISWNVYSLEELCYYIESNPYLLEKDFMNEELCVWVSKEIKNEKLAERLRDIMRMKPRLSDFVLSILVETGYCSKDKIRELIEIISQMEEKSEFECNKIRADRLMENEKYLSSVYEYKRLLESDEAGEQNMELIGNIWHNLGTAYTRLFLFKEAISCYEKAYSLNRNPRSLKECLMVYGCMGDEMGLEELTIKYGVGEDAIQGLKNELLLAKRDGGTERFEQKIEELAKMNTKEQRADYQQEISKIILDWKEEYRRICRV